MCVVAGCAPAFGKEVIMACLALMKFIVDIIRDLTSRKVMLSSVFSTCAAKDKSAVLTSFLITLQFNRVLFPNVLSRKCCPTFSVGLLFRSLFGSFNFGSGEWEFDEMASVCNLSLAIRCMCLHIELFIKASAQLHVYM